MIQLNMKVRFISFAGGENKYIESLNRIKLQANLFKENKIFDDVITYTTDDLKTLDINWWNKNNQFLLNNKRGFGYWIWKPFILLKNLQQLQDGDILIYCDSGCELNIKGIERMKDYINITSINDSLKFSLEDKHLEKKWCKNDLVYYCNKKYNLKKEMLNSPQCMATVQFYKKTDSNIKMLQEYTDICQIYYLINDSPSLHKNDQSFIEHRHDQSVNSLLTKIYNQYIIKDETYPPEMEGEHIRYPIHAIRNYSSQTKINLIK